MNYITEIKGFYDLVSVKPVSTGQIALWHALMCINNKCAWIEWFTVSNQSLELLTGLSRQGIFKNRNILKQLGLIDFKPNGTKATSYKMITTSNSLQDGLQASLQSSLQGSLPNSSTLNKLNKTKHIKDISKDISKKEITKHKYGEFKNVLLTDEELEKLKSKFTDYQAKIENLSTGIELKGYKYKSHYLAILKWAEKEKPAVNTNPYAGYPKL